MLSAATLAEYLTLFRHLPDNLLLLRPDAEFTIVDNTEGHAAVSLQPRAAVVGKPIFEAYPPSDEENYRVLRDSLTHVRQHCQPHTMPLIRYDLARPAAQGGGREERYWQATHYPICNDNDELLFILQRTEDVTARHMAEQQQRQTQSALVESQERARFLLESLPIMLWSTTPDGATDYQNPRWLQFTGRPVGPLHAKTWLEDIHPDDRVRAQAAWEQAQANGHYYEVEYRLRRHDGQYRWVLSQGVARRNEAGDIVAWVGTGLDVHEQREARQLLHQQNLQLTQTNLALDNFVYTAWHELKQPVTNMAGIFEELKRTATFHDEAAAQLVHMFEEALRQVNATLHNLTAVVQVQHQYEQQLPELLELLPFAQEVMAGFQDQLTALDARVSLDVAASPRLLFVRPHLHSILYHLLSNALKYAAPERPPVVAVRTRWAEPGLLELTVQDNGLGIDLARYQSQLFQMFRRFHSHVEGSGMGLYLVSHIVRQLGGHLEVESIVNQGSVFRLLLPLSPA